MPFISLPCIKLHYESAGEGDAALVLVHGNIASWKWWLPVLENPPAGCTVYAPDMRGFGESEHPQNGHTIEQFATDLNAFVTKMALHHVHLVGHSLGAAVALEFAVQNPKKVRKMLLVSPPSPNGMTALTRDNRKPIGSTMPSLLQFLFQNTHMDRAILSHVLANITPGMDHRSKLFTALVDDAALPSRETLSSIAQSLKSWTVEDKLQALNLPVQILWGDKDNVVERSPLELMVRDLPQGELVIWEGIGHAPQLEQPERFHALLTEFIAARTAIEGAQAKMRRLRQFLRPFLRIAALHKDR